MTSAQQQYAVADGAERVACAHFGSVAGTAFPTVLLMHVLAGSLSGLAFASYPNSVWVFRLVVMRFWHAGRLFPFECRMLVLDASGQAWPRMLVQACLQTISFSDISC